MISVINSKSEIEFQCKDRRKRKLDQTFSLLYGVTCPACNNVILASFIVDKPVDLYPYEKTAVMHTRTLNDNGTFNFYSPTSEDPKGHTNYEIKLDEFEGKFIQTIRLKNHILTPDRANRLGKDRMEVGERTCMLSGVASMDPGMVTKLALLVTGSAVDRFINWNFKTPLDTYFTGTYSLTNNGFRIAPSYGSEPMNVILIPKDKVESNIYYYPPNTVVAKKD